MGGTFYSSSNAHNNRVSRGYYTATSFEDVSTQTKLRAIHEKMEPKQALLREARDSENHPNTVPIILALDVTGSMGHIPNELIKTGLPTLMTGLIDKGLKDATLLFLAVGDHTYDRAPLQVGQFESGDEELDMWLTRTWLEKRGGNNEGESYLLTWYYAAMHTVTDAWEKRKQKGYIITIGDEPCLNHLSASAVQEIMGTGQVSYTAKELFEKASEKWHIIHIHTHNANPRIIDSWQELVGQNLIVEEDHTKIPVLIANVIANDYTGQGIPVVDKSGVSTTPTGPVTPHL